MEKKQAKVIKTHHAEQTPTDVAISRNIQNLFATYGEKKVRASLKELFNMEYKPKSRNKVA